MTKKSKEGYCCICGNFEKLTFEHVPPKSAFNSSKIRFSNGEHLMKQINIDDLDEIKTKESQKGAGAYTLCAKCNNLTGHWYGSAFVSWAYQAAHILKYSGFSPSLYYPFHILPLRVIKQVVSMFCSVNGAGFTDKHPEIRKFLLNRDARGLPKSIRIFVYYNISGRARTTGISAMINLGKDVKTLSEMSFFPFGFIMIFDDSPNDMEIVDVTDFAKYGYNEFQSMNLRIPNHDIYTWFPGDFRNKKEVEEQVRLSREHMAANPHL